MAEHVTLAADLGLQVFFCHPHSPWQRATCESQNDRIRHYLPKGTDLAEAFHQQLSAYQEMLNERPRKILVWKSPAQCFHDFLISNQPSSRSLNAPTKPERTSEQAVFDLGTGIVDEHGFIGPFEHK